MGSNFKRDSAGLRAILNSSEVRAMVAGVTNQLEAAANAQLAALPDAQGVTARGAMLTTDRAHGVVGVPARFQSSSGVLTRAASSIGLGVHP